MKKGSSSWAGVSGDTFEPLRFGRKVHFEVASGGGSSSNSVNAPALPDASLEAAGKKARSGVLGFGQPQPPPPAPLSKCQVEGCDLDLKGSKSYYCRHKVCGMHSKSPKVIVAGLEQRFCQQCSRFHLLKEFDQGKRSCRRRLVGHNERRRKPPPPELLPLRYDRPPSFPVNKSSSRRSYLMDFIEPRPPEVPRENIPWPSLSGGGAFSSSELVLGECIVGVSDTTCALSLLSNQLLGAAMASTASPATLTDPQTHVLAPGIVAESTRLNSASSYLTRSLGFNDHDIGSSSSHGMASRQIGDAGNEQFQSIDVGPSEVYDHLHDLYWLL